MWIKGFRILWLNVQVNKDKHFNLTFPISVFVFQELLDSVSDLLVIGCRFSSNRANTLPPAISIHTVNQLVQMLSNLLDSLTESEPYDLVDVTADNVKVTIRIR
jgi:hypothetical protein